MDCCICYDSEKGISICLNDHRVCVECLTKIESGCCPLCRETMTLPKEMQTKIEENKERSRNISFLEEIHSRLSRAILALTATYNIPKNSLPDLLLLELPEGNLPQNFEQLALRKLLDQIKEFSLDRNYTLKKYPYVLLEIIRGKYSVKDVLTLPRD